MALARALVIRPQILLLDEPLSNLDAKLREEMQIELRQIQRTVGTTTILVTHDQAEAMALSDRIVVMNQGRAEQIGPPHEAYERPATPFVASFLGKHQPAGRRHGAAGEDLLRRRRACRHGAHAHLPGQPLALPGRDRRRPGDVIRQNTGEAMPAEGEGCIWVGQADEVPRLRHAARLRRHDGQMASSRPQRAEWMTSSPASATPSR